jgi:hypothetical protein
VLSEEKLDEIASRLANSPPKALGHIAQDIVV